MPPLVSILITAYNAEPWLADTLASATGQTWPNTEVILVDDGSTDATLAVARHFEGPSVRVLHQENRGACAARNAALSEAQGDFIQYLDADDLLAPDKIEVQMRRLAEEPAGAVASCAWSRFYDDLATATFKPETNWKDFEPAARWLVHSWSVHEMLPPLAWLTPRAVVAAAGPWDEALQLNQDGEYFARVLTHASKAVFCPEARVYYRSGLAGSISRRKGEAALRSLFRSYARCDEHLLRVDDSAAARHAVACLWQTFLFAAYPSLPDLTRRAEARVAALGGGSRKAEVSRPFRPVRDLLGWKPALRLHRLWYRLRYPSHV